MYSSITTTTRSDELGLRDESTRQFGGGKFNFGSQGGYTFQVLLHQRATSLDMELENNTVLTTGQVLIFLF